MKLDWMDDAACIGKDPEIFFPSSTGPAGQQQVAAATRICRGCPVAEKCQAHKKRTGSSSGVWGGRKAAGPNRRAS